MTREHQNFIENFYFAWNGAKWRGRDPQVGGWSLDEIKAEIARIRGCPDEATYLRMNRPGAQVRMDRSGKMAFWAAVRGGTRW